MGVRGLHLEKDPAQRLTRLLLAFSLAYILVILLGASRLAETWRPRYQTPQRTPRHGTTTTLSVLLPRQ